MKKGELRLKRKSGSEVKMHMVLLVVLLIAAVVAGFFAGKANAGTSSTGDENCIPQKDLQFFIDKANKADEDYAKCVQDAWTLHLLCKAQVDAWQNTAVSLGYTENSTK
ncbi:hypothetical protein JXB27_00260 [Candidatus Woesearchaeota archaeon]|nr:hypothetical protein [Candidatus Woesearchaeota archaeon]